jgi:glycosyltransferase involved in cell wall biosynthesis
MPELLGQFDSIVCFGGEDYWYHNRGHYDMQMMKQWSSKVPVLYINSIGMRPPNPTEGKMFLKRLWRKLKSFKQGLVKVNPNFYVYSPITTPTLRKYKLGRYLLKWQIKYSIKKLKFKSPLIWVACPPAISVIENLESAGMVYQRTDRFEAFEGVDQELIKSYDTELKKRSNMTLYCSSSFMKEDAGREKKAVFIDHGVDFEYFVNAGIQNKEPGDVKLIPRIRVGFVGGIDRHTFDPMLFNKVVERLPDFNFVMVGACSLPEGWCQKKNVHFLGRKDYTEVAHYMAACDILIMPWNKSDWIKACNPIKLKEYMAICRPIVSTPFDELEKYKDYIYIADNVNDFVEGILKASQKKADPDVFHSAVQEHTWEAKQVLSEDILKKQGLQVRAN